MNKVTASAPGKLMLSGSYAVVHGRPTVVTAVDQRIFVSLEKRNDNLMILKAPDVGITDYQKPINQLGGQNLSKQAQFIETLYKNFLIKYPQKFGLVISTKSDFSKNFGFGSSSAVTVAMAKALFELYEIEATNKQIFDFCYETVIEVQGVGSGFDLAAGIWGGTIYYITPAKVVEKIKVDSLPLVVGYTGVKADTPTLIRQVNERLKTSPGKINKIFDKVGAISDQMKKEIEHSNWQKVGELFNNHQKIMRSLDLSGPELDRLIISANEAGAYGAAFSGAGGGDCMLAVVGGDRVKQVKKALTKAGGQVMDIKLNAPGVRIEGTNVI